MAAEIEAKVRSAQGIAGMMVTSPEETPSADASESPDLSDPTADERPNGKKSRARAQA
jgi:hypothetical protein